MNQYTIYCTTEQTRKALNLGAPIEIGEGKGTILCRLQNYHTYKRCVIPTAEQMIGWMEEKMGITTFHINHYSACKNEGYGYLIISTEIILERDAENEGMYLYQSRKEATLAAIDAALEYLENLKQ